MSSTASSDHGSSGEGSPLFTLALFAVVLVVVFTVAYWVGRTVGPAPAEPAHGHPMMLSAGAGR
jgi:hypothetical protein